MTTFPFYAPGHAQEDPAYQIKAGFLYQFLFFVEWPTIVESGSDDEVVIAILGKDPFGDAFDAVEGLLINGRRLVIKRYDQLPAPQDLKNCRLLFISPSLQNNMVKIIQTLKAYPVLTVSDVKGFVDAGGMINFVIKEDRVRFEINPDAAAHVGIKIRSKLLRVAERIL